MSGGCGSPLCQGPAPNTPAAVSRVRVSGDTMIASARKAGPSPRMCAPSARA